MTFVPRALKTLAVAMLAVAAAHLILSDTLRLGFSAEASATLGSPQGYGSDQAFTTALVNTALVLPLVLWAGLRIAGERKVGIPVLVASVAWMVAVWRGLDAIDDAPGALLPLPSLALVVAVAVLGSLVPRRTAGGTGAAGRVGAGQEGTGREGAGAGAGAGRGPQASSPS
ncbi:hypothetical protein AB0C52_12415 [Streptomyces sp. NPDC048717]|uniref:hypothetical protein n=1 Tax=Streptomyces sp. NPDC048717 TaxID=3154928 RepID=UPI0034284904